VSPKSSTRVSSFISAQQSTAPSGCATPSWKSSRRAKDGKTPGSSFTLYAQQVSTAGQDDGGGKGKGRPGAKVMAQPRCAMNLVERAADTRLARIPGSPGPPGRAGRRRGVVFSPGEAPVATYIFVYDAQVPELQKREDTEQQLRQEFKAKHGQGREPRGLQAAAERTSSAHFGALLRQLPRQGPKCPNLLVDIFADRPVGPASKRSCFQPQAEQKKDFLRGAAHQDHPHPAATHQFGEFVSGIAALPRQS